MKLRYFTLSWTVCALSCLHPVDVVGQAYFDLVRPPSQHSKSAIVVKTGQRQRPAGRTGECTASSTGLLVRPVDLQPAESGQILAEEIINLDGRRGMAAQKTTRMRRLLAALDADHAALRARTWSTCFSPRLPPLG